MLIPSTGRENDTDAASLSRRVNANSQHCEDCVEDWTKLIKKGEC